MENFDIIVNSHTVGRNNRYSVYPVSSNVVTSHKTTVQYYSQDTDTARVNV
jgi:hypothetical protein